MILVLDQGATEQRTIALTPASGDSLVGATARLALQAPSGIEVLNIPLSLSSDTNLATFTIDPPVSSAWVLKSWGSPILTATEGDHTGTGYRADFQVEVTLANGAVRRVYFGSSEDYVVVTPEIIK